MRKNAELPPMEDIEALAAFFDRIDTQDLDWEDVDAGFQKPELVHVTLRLPREDVAAIKRAASRLGVGYTTYIRMVLRKAVGK
ncbi:MAG: CopG family antitoxin [Moorellales bacterium]